jgi:hypothetical protein
LLSLKSSICRKEVWVGIKKKEKKEETSVSSEKRRREKKVQPKFSQDFQIPKIEIYFLQGAKVELGSHQVLTPYIRFHHIHPLHIYIPHTCTS